MTFNIGASITNANPGPAIWAYLDTLLLAEGYTFVDTVIVGARTHQVYKSAAAGNVQGLDWYLDIGYPTTGIASRLTFQALETYNAAADSGARGVYGAQDGTLEETFFSRFGATERTLESWQAGAGTNDMGNLLQTSAFVPYVMLNKDRIGLMMSHAPTRLMYTGFFKPTAQHAAHAGGALYPLISVNVNVGASMAGAVSGNNVAVTRMPRFTAAQFSSATWTQNAYGWSCVTVPANSIMLWGAGVFGQQNHPSLGETQMQELPVCFGAYSMTAYQGAVVGNLDGVGFGWAAAAVQRGDTTPVAGVNWHALAYQSGYAVFMRGN
jgi:hypothetical protein